MPAASRLWPYLTAVLISFVIAMLVAVWPLPAKFAVFRPELACLLVIYWVMSSPHRMGMRYAWLIGLSQDLIEGYVWGAHAMSLTIIAYICLVSYQRIRSYSIWHQAIWVFVLVGLHQVVCNWVQGLAGYTMSLVSLLVPAVISALLWPLLTLILWRLRRAYLLI
ncbi:MAG: rod shape-determining protein MreD [Cellvibrionaceae bacterium]|nr:rod shape-determining protein MreD [Cellvibrionaceae bacterium]